MLDMRPLLSQPILFVLGALQHLGIFATWWLPCCWASIFPKPPHRYDWRHDGPTVIYVNGSWVICSNSRPGSSHRCDRLLIHEPGSHYQPPLMRLFTTKA
jgi:hypothetical protein